MFLKRRCSSIPTQPTLKHFRLVPSDNAVHVLRAVCYEREIGNDLDFLSFDPRQSILMDTRVNACHGCWKFCNDDFSLFLFFLFNRLHFTELITGYELGYCYFRGGWWEDDIGRAYRDITLSMDFAAIIYTRTNRSMPFYVAPWVERFVKLFSRGNRISVIVIVDRFARSICFFVF